ncbi:hypothetical protein MPTK1_8g01990 [Marchantia polymorpha subsp. ruderalis]|uniref:Uncharacterized protein n=1 Tax=Marchantia polymorpha TaxID=3197 RepID=A0A2R6WR19_MARPO|nr:hypothetical protein MARPO_0064s0002 [Marchantia polymorpha]BBN18365.1 hypothetical protein Mp_8g01990 [Marchantia polymorpha subsp. ruderalis]|eukprot:PTQ36309.1 hypothetical protein MARPO_0064s0002 [Marchantia polymorpha]
MKSCSCGFGSRPAASTRNSTVSNPISAQLVDIETIVVHFYPIWEAASVDEWLYNGDPYELFHNMLN